MAWLIPPHSSDSRPYWFWLFFFRPHFIYFFCYLLFIDRWDLLFARSLRTFIFLKTFADPSRIGSIGSIGNPSEFPPIRLSYHVRNCILLKCNQCICNWVYCRDNPSLIKLHCVRSHVAQRASGFQFTSLADFFGFLWFAYSADPWKDSELSGRVASKKVHRTVVS